jgi:hypothetical protein
MANKDLDIELDPQRVQELLNESERHSTAPSTPVRTSRHKRNRKRLQTPLQENAKLSRNKRNSKDLEGNQ